MHPGVNSELLLLDALWLLLVIKQKKKTNNKPPLSHSLTFGLPKNSTSVFFELDFFIIPRSSASKFSRTDTTINAIYCYSSSSPSIAGTPF